jgi:hypothetical protein
MISPTLRRTRLALTVAEEGEPLYSKRLPLTLPSRSNQRGAWQKHAKTHEAHRTAGKLAMPPLAFLAGPLSLREGKTLIVRITREAPKPLDDDNLAGACKSLRDGIADALGVDDRDERVTWLCDQAKAKVPSVLVEVYAMRGET